MKFNTIMNTLILTAAFMLSVFRIIPAQATPDDFAQARDEERSESDFTVTRSDDRNNAACVPGDCSLREAVNAANASATDDTIVFASGLTTITLTNEIVINNAGALTIDGPGASNLTIDAGAGANRIFSINQTTATISGLTLTGGDVRPYLSGGAVATWGGSITFDRLYVTGNVGYGGGGLAFDGGTIRILNSTISGNNGTDEGGGIRNGGGSLTIVNSTISGNTSYNGGGIYSEYGNQYLRNSTITNNNNSGFTAGFSTIIFGNTIIAGNANLIAPTYAPEINCYGAIISLGGNLVGDSPGDSASTGASTLVYQTTDIRDTNPLLGPLQLNSGTTPTHALLGGSPIIDKGLNALAVDPFNGNTLVFDQRGTGFPRIRDGNGDGTATVDIGAFEIQPVNVANLEELYSAVNNPQNAGMQILIAPGIYMLSVNDPNGAARPNSGRLELQENMSLQGAVGDRSSVVIDAANLPASSYNNAPPIELTAAIRMGRGSNSLEWLTVRNAVNGISNITTDLVLPGTVHIRVAHVASSNSQRGIDVRNIGPAMAGRVIEAQIVDNDVYNNRIGSFGEGLRFVNNFGADGGRIVATLSDNRSYNNYLGLIMEDNGGSFANISVSSSRDQFFENGLGALVGGGLSAPDLANGNTVNFTAKGTSFVNNNGLNNFDHGGLIIIGGENTSIPNGTSNNTVNVNLSGCKIGFNQLFDLEAVGARSSIGAPGTNNHVTLDISNAGRNRIRQFFANSIPDLPRLGNTVTVNNH